MTTKIRLPNDETKNRATSQSVARAQQIGGVSPFHISTRTTSSSIRPTSHVFIPRFRIPRTRHPTHPASTSSVLLRFPAAPTQLTHQRHSADPAKYSIHRATKVPPPTESSAASAKSRKLAVLIPYTYTFRVAPVPLKENTSVCLPSALCTSRISRGSALFSFYKARAQIGPGELYRRTARRRELLDERKKQIKTLLPPAAAAIKADPVSQALAR